MARHSARGGGYRAFDYFQSQLEGRAVMQRRGNHRGDPGGGNTQSTLTLGLRGRRRVPGTRHNHLEPP
jgi:hypothetical protein